MTQSHSSPTLRAAANSDAEAMSAVHASAFDAAWDAPAFRGLLDRPGSLAFVAIGHQDGAVLGFILGQVAADEVEVLSIAVTPSARRFGLGRQLLSALLEAAADRGVATLHLEVAADNVAALALYEAEGFAVSGRRKGYYVRATGRADAVLMSRALA